MTKQLWRLIRGEEVKPAPEQVAELESWHKRREIAAGEIYLSLEPSQKVHVKGMEEDPAKMWSTLESIHHLKRPTTRFHAYDTLFSIRKQEDESLLLEWMTQITKSKTFFHLRLHWRIYKESLRPWP